MPLGKIVSINMLWTTKLNRLNNKNTNKKVIWVLQKLKVLSTIWLQIFELNEYKIYLIHQINICILKKLSFKFY